MGRIGDFLKKKELGLPMGVWVVIVALLVFLLYRHYRNKAASSAGATAPSVVGPQQSAGTADQASPADTGSGGGGGGLVGGATDNSGALAGIASDLAQLEQGQNDLISSFQNPVTDPGFTSTPLNPGTPSATTSPLSAPNGIEWGGQTFTTRAQFDAWLKQRGEGWKTYAAKYPKAYAEYLNLPAGKIQTTKAPETKATPTKTEPAVRQTNKTTVVKSSRKVVPTVRRPPVRGGKI